MQFNLKSSVNHLEDAIITISGPALAISGIIAGVDLVTGGHAMQNVPWLTLAWAICLLLTLDFQVLALGARAHRVYLSNKATGRKVAEIILACLVAAGVSYVSIQMQSIIARANVATITIDQAAAQMGINTIALIWERSALVLVLIFLSGWFREDDSTAAVPAPQIVTPMPTINPEVLNLLIERLDHLTVTVTQLTSAPAPALPEHAESRPANLQPIYDARFESKEQEIAAILQQRPAASVEEVAHEAGCSVRTAEKWIERLAERTE